MSDDQVDLGRRMVLGAGAAALVTPLFAPGRAHGRGTEAARSGLELGDPTEKSPEDVAAHEAGTRLGAQAPEGPTGVFHPLQRGDELGFGWTLGEVRAPERGAMLVVLARDGEEARVHVCRNGGCPAGIASTDALDFLLMNQGGGSIATDEDLGRALVALAAVAAQSGVTVAGLMTHEERIERWVRAEPGALQ
jgi:hypothetical protein